MGNKVKPPSCIFSEQAFIRYAICENANRMWIHLQIAKMRNLQSLLTLLCYTLDKERGLIEALFG